MSNPSGSVADVFISLNSPLPQAAPDHLATIARMRGMQTCAAETAAILEIGCGAGSNLLPLADRYPRATFLGMDVSPDKINAARQLASTANLRNVAFVCQPLDQIAATAGSFDYILVPEVYSWVDDRTRELLLSLCQRRLAPQGVVYLNYNVNPGWQWHDMLGTMMRVAAHGETTLEKQLAAARRLLEFVRATLSADDGGYGSLVVATAHWIADQHDAVLIRNYLQGPAFAAYFADFVAHAGRHGLQVLGEAQTPLCTSSVLSASDERRLETLCDDTARRETARDVILGTAHRQSILCRANVPLEEALSPDRMRGQWLEGRFTSPDDQIEMEATATSTFVSDRGSKLSTTLPSLKVAIAYLSSIWPRRAQLEDLLEVVREQVAAAGETFTDEDENRLRVRLLECSVQGLLALHGEPAPFTAEPGERPRASDLLRLQAAHGNVVTSRRHLPVRLEMFDRYVLTQLDGGRDVPQLVELLQSAAANGQIALVEEGQSVPAERAATFIEQQLSATLARLAEHALLVE